jgi:hypothetical protein
MRRVALDKANTIGADGDAEMGKGDRKTAVRHSDDDTHDAMLRIRLLSIDQGDETADTLQTNKRHKGDSGMASAPNGGASDAEDSSENGPTTPTSGGESEREIFSFAPPSYTSKGIAFTPNLGALRGGAKGAKGAVYQGVGHSPSALMSPMGADGEGPPRLARMLQDCDPGREATRASCYAPVPFENQAGRLKSGE